MVLLRVGESLRLQHEGDDFNDASMRSASVHTCMAAFSYSCAFGAQCYISAKWYGGFESARTEREREGGDREKELGGSWKGREREPAGRVILGTERGSVVERDVE